MRAIAALMVIALHASEKFHALFPAMPMEGVIKETVARFDFGRAGVVLFFAISGFVIPSSLRPGDAISKFPTRRFFRLYPAYWLSIVTGIVAVYWLWGEAPPLKTILLNLTMLQRFLGGEDVLGLYWTLQIELMFYAICALLWVSGLIERTRLLAAVSLCAAAYWYFSLASGLGLYGWFLPVRPGFDGYHLEWFAYLSIMFMGASCRRHVGGDMRGLWITGLTVFIWLAAQPLTGIYLYWKNIAPEFVAMKYGAYAIGLWAFFILAFVVRIRHPVMVWLGRISYSLYLQHPIAIALTAWLLMRSGSQHFSTVGICMCVATLATIVLAALSYKFIEAPSIALSDRLTRTLAIWPAKAPERAAEA